MAEIPIVYYSRTGKTRLIAEKLASLLGGRIEEIREQKDRSGVRGFLGGGKDALFGKPTVLTSEHSVEGVETVVIGMPVWANRPPPAVKAYLDAVDLAGKRVCAFCTHDGGGGKGTFAALERLLGGQLLETIDFKKPKPDDPDLLARLQAWAEKVRKAAS